MLRKIKLYGKLAQFVGKRVLQAEIQNAAEAVRFLLANFPGLEQHMADQHYKVLAGADALTLDELHYPSGQQEIKIVPVIAGAGGNFGNIAQIVVGVALIAASIFIPGATPVLGTTFGKISLGVGLVGGSLVLGGVAGLLTPTPAPPKVGKNSDSDPSKSYAFSGVQNTSRQGVPVPIIFGEVIAGSITISAGIDIDEE
jgi:predicted phage tail protein